METQLHWRVKDCAEEVRVVGAALRLWNWSRVGKFCVLGAWVLLEIDWQLETVIEKLQQENPKLVQKLGGKKTKT